MPASKLSRSVPLAEDEPTITVETAGEIVGLSRNSAYAAAKRGDIPTIRYGKRIMVVTAAFRRQLGLDVDIQDEAS